MKKKFIVALITVLILSVTVGMLTGCDEIFKKNEKRDAAQIVATVGYGNQTANIRKSELSSSFNSYSYYYVQSYGMTYQEVADYILRSLAQRELLVLFAKEYVADYLKIGKVPELCTLRELLTDSEYNKAVESTNEDLLSALNASIKTMIEDNAYNTGKTDEEDDEEVEVTDPVKVYFESNGGTEVARQKIQKGTKVSKPDDPTRDGFKFYGWYTDDGTFENKFDFKTKVDSELTLYARWETYLEPRAVREAEEEEEDYDPDLNGVEIAPKFFTDEYKALITSREIELDEEEYYDYLDEGLADVAQNLEKAFHSYDYYLENEMKTLLITKLERLIGLDVTVTDSEIQAQFDALVAQNKETFAGSSTSYTDALSKSLATTYYHKFTGDKSYGFVTNILLKLDDESLKELKQMTNSGTYEPEFITQRRDQLLKELKIHVSNPDYDPEAEFDYNGDEEDVDIIDPMTDPNNPYNRPNTDYNKNNNYNKIMEFGRNEDDTAWEIRYNVKEAPTMAYLLDEVPAFDDGTVKGIVNQIYDSFKQISDEVTAGRLSHVEGIYWLREMANRWLYLVGDDAGSVSSESNNGGLGYLVPPEGEDSSFIDSFTDHARALIKSGTGSYTTDGTVNGSYVFGDSFIENKKTDDNSYAGIFVLLASNVVWDDNAYTVLENEDGTFSERKIDMTQATNGILPMDYIVTYGKTPEDCVTIRDQIEEQLLTGKKSDKYNKIANEFGVKNVGNIRYYEKAYKSLWKKLDK